MKNKLRYFMVLTALAMCFGAFSVTAYAQSNEPQEETAPVEETTEPEETATPNPFTPNGTGTVLDNATSEDEKEFYTIVTENENVFYLVIDKQRDTENVYFLNAVTESDLMALAEPDAEETTEPVEPEPEPAPAQEPEEPVEVTEEPEPEPVPETGTSPIMLVLIGVAVLAVGGLGYYFKIYTNWKRTYSNYVNDWPMVGWKVPGRAAQGTVPLTETYCEYGANHLSAVCGGFSSHPAD